jgi:hypothetical protein
MLSANLRPLVPFSHFCLWKASLGCEAATWRHGCCVYAKEFSVLTEGRDMGIQRIFAEKYLFQGRSSLIGWVSEVWPQGGSVVWAEGFSTCRGVTLAFDVQLRKITEILSRGSRKVLGAFHFFDFAVFVNGMLISNRCRLRSQATSETPGRYMGHPSSVPQLSNFIHGFCPSFQLHFLVQLLFHAFIASGNFMHFTAYIGFFRLEV